MKLAETVTFGGGGLDRAAELRGDSAALEEALRSGDPVVLPIWRGKPLMADHPRGPVPHFVAGDHPILETAPKSRLRFAADISTWEPEDLDATALDGFADASRQIHPAAPDAAFRELRLAMAELPPRDAEMAATAKAMLSWHRSHRFCARWPEGMYSLLAGFVEPGETLEAAVRREVAEETAISVGRVNYLASQPWPYPSSLMIGCIGEAISREITLDPVELEDALWISREDLALALAGHHPRLLPARKGAIARFLMENWLADRLD